MIIGQIIIGRTFIIRGVAGVLALEGTILCERRAMVKELRHRHGEVDDLHAEAGARGALATR